MIMKLMTYILLLAFDTCIGTELLQRSGVTPDTSLTVTPHDDFLRYKVKNQQGRNQWLFNSLKNDCSATATSRCRIVFKVRANVIDSSEVKFAMSEGVILRFVQGVPFYSYWNNRFVPLADSQIRANSQWSSIEMVISNTSVTLFEDGKYKFTWEKDVDPQVSPEFHIQALDWGSTVSFDLGEVMVTSHHSFKEGGILGNEWEMKEP